MDYVVEGFDQLPRNLLKTLSSTKVNFKSKASMVKSVKNNSKLQVAVSCSGTDCSESKDFSKTLLM